MLKRREAYTRNLNYDYIIYYYIMNNYYIDDYTR